MYKRQLLIMIGSLTKNELVAVPAHILVRLKYWVDRSVLVAYVTIVPSYDTIIELRTKPVLMNVCVP